MRVVRVGRWGVWMGYLFMNHNHSLQVCCIPMFSMIEAEIYILQMYANIRDL